MQPRHKLMPCIRAPMQPFHTMCASTHFNVLTNQLLIFHRCHAIWVSYDKQSDTYHFSLFSHRSERSVFESLGLAHSAHPCRVEIFGTHVICSNWLSTGKDSSITSCRGTHLLTVVHCLGLLVPPKLRSLQACQRHSNALRRRGRFI